MAQQKRSRDIMTLWRGKVARIIGQSSDDEVKTLWRLIEHRGLTEHQKYLILEGAAFDVTAERMADREEQVRVRRTRAREQAQQEKEFAQPKKDVVVLSPAKDVDEQLPEVPRLAPHDEIERGPRAPDHESMSPDK